MEFAKDEPTRQQLELLIVTQDLDRPVLAAAWRAAGAGQGAARRLRCHHGRSGVPRRHRTRCGCTLDWVTRRGGRARSRQRLRDAVRGRRRRQGDHGRANKQSSFHHRSTHKQGAREQCRRWKCPWPTKICCGGTKPPRPTQRPSATPGRAASDAAKGFVNLGRKDIVRGVVQVVKKNGGENNLHYHTSSASFWMVLKGRVRFYGPDDVVIGEFGPNEGTITPRYSRYWFENVGDEDLEILQVSAFSEGAKESGRTDAAPQRFEIKQDRALRGRGQRRRPLARSHHQELSSRPSARQAGTQRAARSEAAHEPPERRHVGSRSTLRVVQDDKFPYSRTTGRGYAFEESARAGGCLHAPRETDLRPSSRHGPPRVRPRASLLLQGQDHPHRDLDRRGRRLRGVCPRARRASCPATSPDNRISSCRACPERAGCSRPTISSTRRRRTAPPSASCIRACRSRRSGATRACASTR